MIHLPTRRFAPLEVGVRVGQALKIFTQLHFFSADTCPVVCQGMCSMGSCAAGEFCKTDLTPCPACIEASKRGRHGSGLRGHRVSLTSFSPLSSSRRALQRRNQSVLRATFLHWRRLPDSRSEFVRSNLLCCRSMACSLLQSTERAMRTTADTAIP